MYGFEVLPISLIFVSFNSGIVYCLPLVDRLISELP